MKKHLLSIAIICGIAASFAFQQESLRKQLIGEWRNVYVKIRMNIYDKNAQPMIAEADSSNWETRLQMKPIRTYFKEDNTYYSEYRNLKDSVMRIASGTWSIKDDSLTMLQTKPEASTLKLQVSIKNKHATFSGIIDFAGDGKRDDDYYGIQKKYSAKP